MVATGSNESKTGWLEGAPNTPTTPVDKRAPRGSKKKKRTPSTAAPTAKRPDFRPPIITAPQRTPSVRFDLSGSHKSAFTAVEPRTYKAASVSDEGSTEGTATSITTPTSHQDPPNVSTAILYDRQGIPNQGGEEPGPADNSERVNKQEKAQDEAASVQPSRAAGGGLSTTDHRQELPKDTATVHDPEQSSPCSPDTPLIKNTRNWLHSQKEPFQRPGLMPQSPPISMRHLMNSGKTLPELLSPVKASSLKPASSPPSTTNADESMQVSPPLSPLQLDESIVALEVRQRDSSTSPTTSDVNLRLADPTSPPISPFDIDAVGFQHDGSDLNLGKGHHAPPSPPLNTLKVHCTAQMMASALSLPTLQPPSSHQPIPREMSPDDDKAARNFSSSETHEDHHLMKCNNQEDDLPESEPPSPPSPPTLPRSNALRDSWLQNEQEPFLLEQMMQEEPMSPPISDTNLIVRRSTSNCNGNVVSSPPATLEMTQALLKELNQSQTKKEEDTVERHLKKTRQSKRNRKREIYKQLHHAQQVVRVLLRGSEHTDQDIVSPRACYEAIRHYAELRVETSKLTTQLEDSKQQLKDLYLEWKGLRKEMQQSPEVPLVATGIDHDSMAILQQMLSDDDSVYKEDDDATHPVEPQAHLGLHLLCKESFSVAENVDQQNDPAMAMDNLFQEMRSELDSIRSAWHDSTRNDAASGPEPSEEKKDPDQEELIGSHTSLAFDNLRGSASDPEHALACVEERNTMEEKGSLSIEASSSTKGLDVVDNPLEGSDSFLLAKIEELTAQIESMEKNRIVLSGYMDQLAQEVIQPDCTAEGNDPNLKPNTSSNTNTRMPDDWTTFGSKFPIYCVKESENEETAEEDDDVDEPIDKNDVCTAMTEPSNLEGTELESIYRPHSLLLRAKRFHVSNDSDHDMLPIHLPGSRGVSFERGELKQTLSEFEDDEEDNIRTALAAKFAQPHLFQESGTEDDDIDSEGSLEKKVASMSFESFFLRRRFSEPTSLARRKLHSTFLRRFKTKRLVQGEEKIALLTQEDSILGGSNGETLEISSFMVDPFSSTSSSSSPVGDKRPPILDAELIQKLQSPELRVQLALPRKIGSVPAQEADEVSTIRPSSPQVDKKDNQEGYVRLCSRLLQTQQNLHQSRAQLKLLQKKHKELILELKKAEREAAKWKQLAGESPRLGTSISSSLNHGVASREAEFQPRQDRSVPATLKEETKGLIDRCKQEKVTSQAERWSFEERLQNLLKEEREAKAADEKAITKKIEDLQTQLAESQTALDAMEEQYNLAASKLLSMQKRDSMASVGIEVKLLEKAEECDRLSSQVTSLTEQLEKQMAKVAELELQVAAHARDKAERQQYQAEGASRTGPENSGQLDNDTGVVLALPDADAQEETGSIALAPKETIHHRTPSPPRASTTSPQSSIEKNKANSRHQAQSPITSGSPRSSPKRNSGSSPKRNSGTAKGRASGIIRGIFNKKRFSLHSPKHEKKTLSYASMPTRGEEDNGKSSDIERKNPFDAAAAARLHAVFSGDAAFPGDMKVDAGSGSLDESNNTSAAASSAQFQTKTSMDLSAREDAQLATIHVLTKRIEELEEENSKLKSTIGRTECQE